jgi:hypothetical protein
MHEYNSHYIAHRLGGGQGRDKDGHGGKALASCFELLQAEGHESTCTMQVTWRDVPSQCVRRHQRGLQAAGCRRSVAITPASHCCALLLQDYRKRFKLEPLVKDQEEDGTQGRQRAKVGNLAPAWQPLLLPLQHASCTCAAGAMQHSCCDDSRQLWFHVYCSKATLAVPST